MKCKKTMAILLSAAMVLSMTACGNDSGQENENADSAEDRGKITVTFGRQTTTNPKFPEGDTYEDNAYIRMVEAELNIDIVDEFEAEMGENYDRQVSLALSSGSLPDIMMVSSLDELRELYENGLIADLTEVYENGVSDYIKEIYDSYEGRALENVTFDGKIMAFPGTIADQGPSMCWVRSDWVEKLGITIDEDNDRCLTIAEVEELAKTFLEKIRKA